MRLAICALLSASIVSSAASAQRADENAVRSAEDAFGSSIGDESIGLYSPYSVRGFSPFAAGNVRVEGLYYDAVAGFNGRLIRGSTVRVGISAQGYPFPAPTGIADFRLRIPGDHPALSLVAGGDSWGGLYTQVDGQLPLVGDKVALGAGVHRSKDKYSFAGGGVHSSAAVLLRLRPTKGVEIIPFWSGFRHHGMDQMPIVITNGDFLPSRLQRGNFITQPWAKYKGVDQNFGTIARWRSAKTEVAAGLFRSVISRKQSFSDLFVDVDRENFAGGHLMSIGQPQQFSATSGEVRGSQAFAEGPRLHTFILSARGTRRERKYGGSASVDLGPTMIESREAVPQPEVQFGSYTRDHIRQEILGVGYEGRWKGLGELTLGLQHVSYEKKVVRPGLNDPPTKASPWLLNAGAAVTLSSQIALYGSYTRGLEESPVAPTFATNRDEAPPAIMTKQYDAGLRWTVTPGIKFVGGLFNVEKPYFSVDAERRYRQLGQVRHRGAEISLVGQLGKRLSLVAGAILLDATVSGEEVDSGAVGKRPVGSVPTNLLLSVDYQLPWLGGLSADVTFNRLGRQPANSANTLFVPPTQTVDAGLRYATKIGAKPVSFRVQVSNLFDDYSWDVFGSNAFFYTNQRQVSFRVATDL